MIKKRLKRALGVAIPFAILVISIGYNSYVKMHTLLEVIAPILNAFVMVSPL